ncbi:PREDICTED: low-density lipoprotein receptor-related protein 6 [Nicrophorus vespilloides]|uniref:Low-density lipoprotein receptor-related protein 6 n=1 Tax=Nicrophorus vespilloides TaxID=110193 RepID=A0ABM1MDN4_NICVS|nr:PREDICTED: low-density lipoprotein receptor-related protein 6 [Nicrophorus vespilloides]
MKSSSFYAYGLLYITSILNINCYDNNPLPSSTLLLYSTTTDIRIVNITKPKFKPTILIKNLTDGAALDFHYGNKKICWTDHGLESIQCVGFNSTAIDDNIDIIGTGILSPDGLACDWFTNKLYWTDSDTNRIEVASIDKKYRKVLFWTDMDQPRAIALDPMQGLMFWTDWGEIPKIERASMDGNATSRQIIVSEDIFWPNGLTLDYENKFIYWIDGKFLFLKKMDYDGYISEKVKDGLDYPFALTQFHNKLYWTDWKKWSIFVYDHITSSLKNTSRDPKELLHSDVVPMDIHVWDPNRQPIREHACEKNNGGCSHLCLLSSNYPYFTCACPIGIKLLNNTTCANEPQEMLIFARRYEMCVIYLDSPDYTYRALNLTSMKFSIAVDYDPLEGFIYWTDTSIKKIQKARLDGSEQTDVLSFEIDSSDGIAIDWVARNIYWTDNGLDRIEVATLNGKYRKVIISDGLLNPRAVAVDPHLGWLFWSDWHEKSPKIERANMDGSERFILVSDNLGWANGIALDLQNMKIYWCDAKNDIIEFANMDGTDRRVLVNENIPHPFGFTLMGDFLYWTDWQRRTISRVHKETGSNRETIVEQLPNIMGLKAIKGDYGNERITDINPCGKNNGGCSQICLYLHNGTFTCVCQIGYELLKDKRKCVIPESFLLYAKHDGIARVSVENEDNDIQLPVTGVKNASSIDFDRNNMRIYWSDVKQRTIMRAYVNGSDPQKVVELGLISPEGLAVDWVAFNIYWADPAAHKIEVARLDGSSRRVLLWGDLNVEPHSIAIDPQEGYMYWTEWAPLERPSSLNSIKKAAMDGSRAKILVVKTDFAIGLTLDYERRRIYWVEPNTPNILSCDLNGLNKQAISNKMIFRPKGLTMFKEFIYWIDELSVNKVDIKRVNKNNISSITKIHSFVEPISDLLVISNSKQRKVFNQCAVNNGDCSHLCLALPSANSDEKLSYTCACPTHYVLQNNTCLPPKSFMIYSHKNLAVRLLPDTSECVEAVLPIQGLRSVKAIDFDPILQFLYWVEGKTRSIKKAKAIGTHVSTVVPSQTGVVNPVDIALDALGRLLFWSCSIQDVINVTRVDNSSNAGIVVKAAGEKPRLIVIHPTKRLLIYTNVGVTPQIIRTRMDGSHRIVISQSSNVAALAVDIENDLVVWAQGHSIHVCNIDGDNNHVILKDNTSKLSQLTVHAGWLYWLDKENLQRLELKTGGSRSIVIEKDIDILDLISVSELDKNHSCAQMHQQRCSHLCIFNGTNAICACPQGLALQDDKRTCTALPDCGSEFFTCSAQAPGNKDCIPSSWKCDGQMDCQDQSDEMGCPACRSDQFRCQNGDCIDYAFACDDFPHCRDKSDEIHCCKHSHEFQCPRTDVCIPISSLCDGIEQCADGEDEKKSVCLEASRYVSTGIMGLSSLLFWIFIIVLSVATGIGVFCYITRKMNVDTNIDQSEDPLNPSHINNPLKNASQKLRKGIPDVVHMSMLNGSQISNYDRDNITGASSTNGSSSLSYPRETLNPPPSPATIVTSSRAISPSARYKPYKHYRSINQPPLPTPCSTDICDESDCNYTIVNRNQDDRGRYDIGMFPPPPTPRSHCNSESCPPSPSSRSSTYFSPLPPPPSPVALPFSNYNT